MTHCPSDDTLASLLDDALSAAEQAAVAKHVEECALCLDKLARLSENENPDVGQSDGRTIANSAEEDEVVGRLKLARRRSESSSNPREMPTLDGAPGKFTPTATIDFEIPSVPGYEILEV